MTRELATNSVLVSLSFPFISLSWIWVKSSKGKTARHRPVIASDATELTELHRPGYYYSPKILLVLRQAEPKWFSAWRSYSSKEYLTVGRKKDLACNFAKINNNPALGGEKDPAINLVLSGVLVKA